MIYYLVEKQSCIFDNVVSVIEVSNSVYNVFCEIFKILFSNDLGKFRWLYLPSEAVCVSLLDTPDHQTSLSITENPEI